MPNALKRCPKSNKSPNLVTLMISQNADKFCDIGSGQNRFYPALMGQWFPDNFNWFTRRYKMFFSYQSNVNWTRDHIGIMFLTWQYFFVKSLNWIFKTPFSKWKCRHRPCTRNWLFRPRSMIGRRGRPATMNLSPQRQIWRCQHLVKSVRSCCANSSNISQRLSNNKRIFFQRSSNSRDQYYKPNLAVIKLF